MNIARGQTNHIIIAGRETLPTPHFLLVFESKDQPVTYQYVICVNEGNSTGPLLLEVLETGTAPDNLDREVTLSAGDWHMVVYEQSSSTNLDPALAGRQVWSELTTAIDT